MQMRFPLDLMRKRGSYQSHHMTLLDGELIVDEDRESGKHTYRYLAYDAMAIHGKSLVNRPWQVTQCSPGLGSLPPSGLPAGDESTIQRAQPRCLTRSDCRPQQRFGAGCSVQLLPIRGRPAEYGASKPQSPNERPLSHAMLQSAINHWMLRYLLDHSGEVAGSGE